MWGTNRAVLAAPGDILCLTEGFSRLGSKLPVRHRAGAPEQAVRDVNTRSACGVTKNALCLSERAVVRWLLYINLSSSTFIFIKGAVIPNRLERFQPGAGFHFTCSHCLVKYDRLYVQTSICWPAEGDSLVSFRVD